MPDPRTQRAGMARSIARTLALAADGTPPAGIADRQGLTLRTVLRRLGIAGGPATRHQARTTPVRGCPCPACVARRLPVLTGPRRWRCPCGRLTLAPHCPDCGTIPSWGTAA